MALAVVAVRHHVSGIYMGHQIKDIYGGMMLVHYIYWGMLTVWKIEMLKSFFGQLWSTMVNLNGNGN